jgi:hypothetical protein
VLACYLNVTVGYSDSQPDFPGMPERPPVYGNCAEDGKGWR